MTVEAPKKFTKDYQAEDESGNPIGPPQHFEADTESELVDRIAAAHKNASATLYKTRRAAKLGELLDADPDEPLQTYEERQLTADETIQIENLQKDPRTRPEAMKLLLEAQFGAPLEKVRATLRDAEIAKRVEFMKGQVELFKAVHPEYVECDSNKDTLVKYLNKRNLALTKKNLEIAFEDLNADGLIIVRAPKQQEIPVAPSPVATAIVEPAVPVIPPVSATVAPAPPPEPVIPVQATPAAPISVQPTTVQPRQSSSGLGRANTSAQQTPALPKPKTITAQEIASMTAAEYATRLRDPEFVKQVEALTAKK